MASKLGNITLPQSTTQKETTQEQQRIAFNTDKYGELVVTGVGLGNYIGGQSYSIPISTNQGDFVFIADDFVTKGQVADIDVPGKPKQTRQYYSKAFIGDNRDAIFDSAVGVDLSAIPEISTGSKGREALYGIEGGDNKALKKLISKKGILVPSDVAEQIKASSYEITDEIGAITGLVDTSNNPYVDSPVVYAREGSESAPRGSVDLRYVDAQGQTGYTYSWEDSGGWLSEKLGEVVDFADDLIQNPWARLGVSIFYPAVGTVLNAYAKLDSGEELSGGDIAGLVAAGSNLADVTISDAAAKGLEVGAKLADGASIESIVVDEIASGALEDTEIGQSIKKSVQDTVGSDVVDFVQNNEATVRTVVDVSQGKDLSESIVDNFGDTIVEATGAETTNEIAAVKGALDTAVQLDQGADKDEAALAGMSKYIDEGGTVDLDIDTDLTGDLDLVFSGVDIDLPDIDLPDVSVALPSVDLPEVADIDLPDVELPDVSLPEVDLPEVAVDLPEVDLPEVDLPDVSVDLPDVSIDLPEVADVDLPDIEGPDLPEVDGPDIDIDLDFSKKKGMLLDDETSPVFELAQYAFAQGLDPLGQIRPVLPRLNYYLTNNRK